MEVVRLEVISLSIRKRLIDMHYQARAGHLGSGLSSIEILTYLYWQWKNDGDQFLLSKGHAASALYATLAEKGLLSEETMKTYYKDGTLLSAHPMPGAFDEIPVATGSLGHGICIATGMALSYKKYKKTNQRVSVLVSDGECNEGSVWESAMFASRHELSNLLVVVDANGLQGFGKTAEVLKLEPLVEKWRAFGFKVSEVNGHDFSEIHRAVSAASGSQPHAIVCRTIKGKGVSFMENELKWHYLPMSDEQYAQAKREQEK